MSTIVVLVLTTVLVAVIHGTGETDRRQGGAVARRSSLSSGRAPRAPRAGMTAVPASARRRSRIDLMEIIKVVGISI
jgi:hypothetical protein